MRNRTARTEDDGETGERKGGGPTVSTKTPTGLLQPSFPLMPQLLVEFLILHPLDCF